MTVELNQMAKALAASWSDETCSNFRPDNPAAGQCDVSSLVVQDILGGDLVRTWDGAFWHYYNRIDGQRHDFTAMQYDTPFDYQNLPTTRDEAMKTTTEPKYLVLKSKVLGQLEINN